MLRIGFLDLNHTTCGVHNNTVPLGSGLIASYIKRNIDVNLDIKLFKEVEKALETFEAWIPDILGLALYGWNTELNLHIAKIVKKKNLGCMIVVGGPNLDLSSKAKLKFLQKHDFVDIGVEFDGEIPFLNIVNMRLLGKSIKDIKKTMMPGVFSLDPDAQKLVNSSETAPKIKSLDEFGAVYADGVFDEFLEQGYNPFLQTHRGCPFTCAFCHTSNSYYSKMIFQSPEIFRKDMEYLGKFFSGRHDITLYIANTNMSLFKQDFAVAGIIKEVQERYDWPRFISVNSGKDTKKLLEMLSIIKFMPGLALQSLTPKVLENIRRANIPLDKYTDFQNQVLRMTGEISGTELILCLPGETKQSFLTTLEAVLNTGVQNIVIYTLMNLKGTPLASEEYAKCYGHKICHRIVPRQFSVIDGDTIFDTEEVVIGTTDMPFEDYLELRGIIFSISTFFSSIELIPLKRFLLEYGIDLAKWIFNTHSQISEYPDLNKIFKSFLIETKEELYASREDLIEYFSEQKNYADLVQGKRGDNLVRKYKCIMLSENYLSCLKLVIQEAKKLAKGKLGEIKSSLMIDDIENYLLTRDLKQIVVGNKFPENKTLSFEFDVPKWLNSKKTKFLDEFKDKCSYVAGFSLSKEKKLKKFINMNRNRSLSLQILYRDGGIRDLWPELIKQ